MTGERATGSRYSRRVAPILMMCALIVGWPPAHAALSSETITTKYTWPRGHNRALECHLAQVEAENRARKFVNKVGRSNIVKLDVSDCDCKKWPDKLWGCKASATIEYWTLPEGGLERDVKEAILEKFVSHVVPTKESALSALLKLANMKRTEAFLLGTRVLSYANSFQGILNRIERVAVTLEKLRASRDYQLSAEENKLIGELERTYSQMQRKLSSFHPLERRVINGDANALNQMRSQWEDGFRANQCITAKVADGKVVLVNRCDHAVWVGYCATRGKKTCGKGRKYYHSRVKMRPGESREHGYQIPAAAGIEFAACVERMIKQVEDDGMFSCANPY